MSRGGGCCTGSALGQWTANGLSVIGVPGRTEIRAGGGIGASLASSAGGCGAQMHCRQQPRSEGAMGQAPCILLQQAAMSRILGAGASGADAALADSGSSIAAPSSSALNLRFTAP